MLVFSFVMTYVIGLAIHKTMGFRVSEDEEVAGIDLLEHAETAYDLSGSTGGASGSSGAVVDRRRRRRAAKTEGSIRMKLITAIIKPHQLDEVKEALEASASPA